MRKLTLVFLILGIILPKISQAQKVRKKNVSLEFQQYPQKPLPENTYNTYSVQIINKAISKKHDNSLKN